MTLLAILAVPQSAPAEERYDSRKAGHPVRIAAYAAHPLGVILDYMIFRPAWYIGGKEPFRTLFGRAPLPPRDLAPLAAPGVVAPEPVAPEPVAPGPGAPEGTAPELSHSPHSPD
jgi:hypothetical protein